jgi:hypothetical protein
MIKFIVKTKEIFFMVFFSLLTLSVLNSCSKTSKLDGTTWKGSYSYQREDNHNGKNFLKKSDVAISFSESAVNIIENYTESYEPNFNDTILIVDTVTNKIYSGTYTYSKKSITIHFGGDYYWIGTMDDKNTMKLNILNIIVEGPLVEPVKFTKQ